MVKVCEHGNFEVFQNSSKGCPMDEKKQRVLIVLIMIGVCI
jgi:hypothetical protein